MKRRVPRWRCSASSPLALASPERQINRSRTYKQCRSKCSRGVRVGVDEGAAVQHDIKELLSSQAV
eukprot:scaffold219853_cov33-Tisochrysis_lutea.AAC.3